jgi:mono/diheme cytochrome c family protein
MRLLLLFVAVLSIAAGAPASTFRTAEMPASAIEPNATQLYSKHCASCHGKDGRAKTFKAKFNHARDLTDPLWQDEVSDERLFNSIMNGRKKMPSYKKKLSEEQINSLVAYVRTLAR